MASSEQPWECRSLSPRSSADFSWPPGGMFYVLLLGMAVLGLSVVHLAFVRVEERPEAATTPDGESADLQPRQNKVDLRGTLRVVHGVPGLLALIGFACFNNFLGGAFMALMDAYGLYMVSVQTWGLLCGALSASSSSVVLPSLRLV